MPAAQVLQPMNDFPRKLWNRALLALGDAERSQEERERILLAIGRQESNRVRSAKCTHLADAEFRIFSQWGEDGIIQYLLGKVPVSTQSFIEFGVQDYRESNTRFLLMNDNWTGLIIDGSEDHHRYLQSNTLGWRHDVRPVTAFVTRENVNELFTRAGFTGDIGLLSIDIDGVDYWVWKAIEAVSPRIVVAEYNSLFGLERAVTVPYDASFDRSRAHYSNVYFGASLRALCDLASTKGYAFVGSNSAGCNAFFVRRDVLGSVREVTVDEGWIASRFRQARGQDGRLLYDSSHRDQRRMICDLPLVEVPVGTPLKVRDLEGGI